MRATTIPHDPLVVAVEGLSFAGKTTLANGLASLVGGVVIPEYAELAALPPFPPRDQSDVEAALEHFLRLERDRAHAARTAAVPVVVLDRCPLTLIAYEFGITALGVPAEPGLAVLLYSEAADAGDILTPHGYLYLRVSDQVTAARAAARGPIARHLSHPEVRAGIELATHRYLGTLSDERWRALDGSRPAHELVDEATGFVRHLSVLDGAAQTWWALAEPDLIDT